MKIKNICDSTDIRKVNVQSRRPNACKNSFRCLAVWCNCNKSYNIYSDSSSVKKVRDMYDFGEIQRLKFSFSTCKLTTKWRFTVHLFRNIYKNCESPNVFTLKYGQMILLNFNCNSEFQTLDHETFSIQISIVGKQIYYAKMVRYGQAAVTVLPLLWPAVKKCQIYELCVSFRVKRKKINISVWF